MISADVKNNMKQEIKELVAGSYNFYKKCLQNLKYNVKKACISHLILVGVSLSLTRTAKHWNFVQNKLNLPQFC